VQEDETIETYYEKEREVYERLRRCGAGVNPATKRRAFHGIMFIKCVLDLRQKLPVVLYDS
jgi:hypothetical protein